MTRNSYQHLYEGWTRRPVFYLSVMLGDNLVGYLWGSQDGDAAGFFPRHGSGINHVMSSAHWYDKLEENKRLGLTPAEAIRYWIGKPADPEYGGISADAEPRAARTIQELALQLNPDKPLGEGPFVQDGTYPSGAPEDRSQGWGPLVSAPLSTYPTETTSAVVYLPITRNGTVFGYLWAATNDNAAGFLERTTTGRDGMVVGGLWLSRLIDAYEAGLPALEGFQHIRKLPPNAPERYGVIDPKTPEQHAESLAELRQLADQN